MLLLACSAEEKVSGFSVVAVLKQKHGKVRAAATELLGILDQKSKAEHVLIIKL